MLATYCLPGEAASTAATGVCVPKLRQQTDVHVTIVIQQNGCYIMYCTADY